MLLANVRLGLVVFNCRSTKELVVLLLGNIGETPEMDNTEINSEIKESESSYSVEVETSYISEEYNTSKSVRHPNAGKVMDENVRGTYW